ncbi:hypothetical protein BGX26_006141, partial [Mortierella sp. AD094]
MVNNDDDSNHTYVPGTQLGAEDSQMSTDPQIPHPQPGLELQASSAPIDLQALQNLLRESHNLQDPNLVEAPRLHNFYPPEGFDEILPSIALAPKFFQGDRSKEDNEYYDLKHFAKTSTQPYTCPTLPTVCLSEQVKRRDREWSTIANHLAQITRLIDATAYALSKLPNAQDLTILNTIHSLDVIRYQLSVACHTIDFYRKADVCRSKNLLTPNNPNNQQQYLFTPNEFVEQAKLTTA